MNACLSMLTSEVEREKKGGGNEKELEIHKKHKRRRIIHER